MVNIDNDISQKLNYNNDIHRYNIKIDLVFECRGNEVESLFWSPGRRGADSKTHLARAISWLGGK